MPQVMTKKTKMAVLTSLAVFLTSWQTEAAPSAALADRVIAGIWQSWMLTDHEHKEPSGKKVVKSIFDHMPTIRPDCADGWEPNASGKCIKLVTIPEDEQEKIQLSFLNKRYEYITSDSEEAAKYDNTMSQRFQIDLPFISADYQDVITEEPPPPTTTESDIYKSRDRNSKYDVNTIPDVVIFRKGPRQMNTKLQHRLNNTIINTTHVSMHKKMRFRNTRRKTRTKQRRKRTKKPNRANG